MQQPTRTELEVPGNPATTDAVGQNVALIFASAAQTGQSEAVVREALSLLSGTVHNIRQSYATSSDTPSQQPAD